MGRPVIDLSNQRFGKLLVLYRDTDKPSGQGKSAYWICRCDCGQIKSIRMDKLRTGATQSCGCYSKEVRSKLFLNDLTNQNFGRLTVIERDTTKPMGKGQFAYWTCKCQCGNIVSVRSAHLKNGTTQSCGCLNSSGEEKISHVLQKQNQQYRTQYTFPDLCGDKGLLRFDFALFNKDKLIALIEYQGEQHYRKWGNESLERFLKRKEYDQKKRDYCQKHNINLIEIPYTDYNKLNWSYIGKQL